MNPLPSFFRWCTVMLAACAAFVVLAAADSGVENPRLRLVIETDLPGGDPDDEGSMVRFLTYVNEWDVEGIFCTRHAEKSRTKITGKYTMLKFIDAYEQGYTNLVQHDPAYPSPDFLRSITRASSAGRDLMISILEKDDPRPIWYVNWGTNDGNLTAMRLALDELKDTRPPPRYKELLAKLYFSRDANRSYHVTEHIPHLGFWVDTRDPDRWYWRFKPLTATAGGFDMQKHILQEGGPLGALYTINKEGDTTGFLYLVPNGLNDVLQPQTGGWAGRFSPRTDEFARDGFFWSDAQDTWEGVTNRDNTLKRWAVHIQNDFRARLQWSVKAPAECNHPPRPVVNNHPGLAPLHLEASSAPLVLDAGASSDPDGDSLTYQWIVYPEAGTYRSTANFTIAQGAVTQFEIPADMGDGETLHIILQVTDNGEPALTRYRRIIITKRPHATAAAPVLASPAEVPKPKRALAADLHGNIQQN